MASASRHGRGDLQAMFQYADSAFPNGQRLVLRKMANGSNLDDNGPSHEPRPWETDTSFVPNRSIQPPSKTATKSGLRIKSLARIVWSGWIPGFILNMESVFGALSGAPIRIAGQDICRGRHPVHPVDSATMNLSSLAASTCPESGEFTP